MKYKKNAFYIPIPIHHIYTKHRRPLHDDDSFESIFRNVINHFKMHVHYIHITYK